MCCGLTSYSHIFVKFTCKVFIIMYYFVFLYHSITYWYPWITSSCLTCTLPCLPQVYHLRFHICYPGSPTSLVLLEIQINRWVIPVLLWLHWYVLRKIVCVFSNFVTWIHMDIFLGRTYVKIKPLLIESALFEFTGRCWSSILLFLLRWLHYFCTDLNSPWLSFTWSSVGFYPTISYLTSFGPSVYQLISSCINAGYLSFVRWYYYSWIYAELVSIFLQSDKFNL